MKARNGSEIRSSASVSVISLSISGLTPLFQAWSKVGAMT